MGTEPADIDDDLDAEIDAEEAQANEGMRRVGITDAEIERIRGKTVEEVAPPKPASLVSVSAELEEIARLRTTDPKAYWSDEVQAKSLRLIETQLKLKAGRASAQEQSGEPVDQGDALKEIDSMLAEEWEKSGGVAHNLATVRSRTQVALDALEPEEGEALKEGFDTLPAEAQHEIARYLAVDGSNWPAASDAKVQAFAETEQGAGLVQTWGNRAAKNLGNAEATAKIMLRDMTPEHRQKAEAWAASLSPAQKASVIKALAG